MEFSEKNVASQLQILKRRLGGELQTPITIAAGAFTDGVCKAGNPIAADGTKAAVTGDTKGVWTVQITTAFANDETIVVGGVTYTKKSTESITDKQFEGSTAAAQVTSLLKMVKLAGFTVASVSGATDKIGFTQVVADADGAAPVVTKTGTTGVVGDVTSVTTAVTGSSNAVGILLDDVYSGNPNGSIVKAFAAVNETNCNANAGITITAANKKKLSLIVFEA